MYESYFHKIISVVFLLALLTDKLQTVNLWINLQLFATRFDGDNYQIFLLSVLSGERLLYQYYMWN